MSKLNKIGLNKDKSKALVKSLNVLLADYQVMYMNVRGYHWNIKGHKFFELHLKFEEIYNNLQIKIDEIAERILTLGHTPTHSYSEYLKLSTVKENTDVNDGIVALSDILKSFEEIILLQRKILSVSSEMEDEGTNALMSDYIREQEKMIWMFSSYLSA
ncbi:MAG: Dps family protein [Bacteroidota bacterium]|nr:Dps family protein [Bacteroidota bacterium]